MQGNMQGMALRGWLLLALALFAGSAFAAGPGAVRKQIESSLLLQGKVDIEADGSVSRVVLDKEDRLPSGVVDFVRSSALQWTFEPATRDGKPVAARAPMSVRVVAKRQEGDSYQIAIRNVSFDTYDERDPAAVGMLQMRPPAYPEAAFRAGAGGMVYLVVKVGRDGKPEQAFAEQVNLQVVASENDMRRLRDIFAKSALAAARKWTFRPPTQGEAAAEPYWIVRVPVSYTLQGNPNEGNPDDYGRWVSYVPGPRQPAPWPIPQDRAQFSPDALPGGGVYMAGRKAGPRLLTALEGG
ncbi:energy transducer TonB [Xanthomonas sp.]|uniref:energy transducer TonB n=1 Tax=Xanthomonas sp. TaxID=29446 RepID=UPI001F13511E|nr:energy transducer TonB [Xanthomonas sp.]